MVCDIAVGARGELARYQFYPAAIRSHARLTYTQVAQAIYETPARVGSAVAPLLDQLKTLDQVFRALLHARGRRGAIDFETIETEIEFDDRGKIARIVPRLRNDAHRLIEECMLAANVCASDFLQRRGHKALYRIHEGPKPEKLEALREFLRSFGLHLGGGDEPHAKEYAKLLAQIKSRPDVQLLQTVLLRSLQQAVYSPENVGHFGLAYESYTHFTSPIRRYPDLVIHRAIKAALAGGTYSPGRWDDVGKHCSMTERRADEATRDVETWLKCYYKRDRVGEEFEGSVSAVTGFGIFVALDDVYVEGLVHISELGNDYFHFDAVHHALRGERTGKTFRLADRVRVRVARGDLELGRIDFVPA
jgi:ribonuclease R